jgi:hypothetical protein
MAQLTGRLLATSTPVIVGLTMLAQLTTGGCEPGSLDVAARRATEQDGSPAPGTWPPGGGSVGVDPDKVGNDGGSSGGNDGGSSGPACAPVKHYTFTLNNDVGLYCECNKTKPYWKDCPNQKTFQDGFKTIFNVNIPAQGYAVARANLLVRHLGKGAKSHFWNSRVTVGKDEFTHGIGDDLCHGEVRGSRMNIGYGVLGKTSPTVTVRVKQGSTGCWSGIVEVVKGSKLEVWVEDPRPQCQKKQILVQSYRMTTNGTTYFKWQQYHWKTILQKSITTKKQTAARLISVIQATTHWNPNDTCGKKTAKVQIMTHLGKKTVIKTKPLPATQGMGQLVMNDDFTVTLPAGTHAATLSVNQLHTTPKKINPTSTQTGTTTGGCCGDGYLVAILGPVTSL